MKWYHSYETLEVHTPSRLDGVDFENEARYRKEGARFIMDIGNKLGLCRPYLSIASGIVFFHRFYMFHSFKEFSRWVTAPTCLFLAGKVEETPKKCRDILKITQQALPDHRFKAFGDNPREEVMIIERILLQTIKFDLHLNHPYTFLIKYGKLLKGDMEKINGFVQKAWIFINDSLSTTLCLVYKPQVVALAVLLLAFKMSNQNIRDFMGSKARADWWKSFYQEAREADLEEICEVLTNMYKGKPPKKRFPNVSVDKLKNPLKAPGSPQPKKSKLQQPHSESPLAATTLTTTTTTTPATSTTSATTTPPIATTTSAVTTTSSTSSTTHLQSLTATPGKGGSLTINTSSGTNSTVQPMQLATPTTTKASFNIQEPTPPVNTPPAAASQPKPPPQEQALPYPQPIQLPTPYPTAVNPKVVRHEQLKSFMQQQQHSPNHPNISATAATTHGLHRSHSQSSSTAPLQSPYKPTTAPILDHMSSFFQSTPPSKTQQPPQPPPPRPIQPPPQPKMQNSPGHIMQQSRHHHQTPQKSMMDMQHQQVSTPQMQHMQPQGMSMPPQQPLRPPVPPISNPQFNTFQQQQQNTMQNFQANVPQSTYLQMPSTFPGQPSNFMPIPPTLNQQQQQQQSPFLNNTMGATTTQMAQQNAFNFNTQQQQQQQPLLMQNNNRLPQPPQNNMGGQHSFQPGGNYY